MADGLWGALKITDGKSTASRSLATEPSFLSFFPTVTVIFRLSKRPRLHGIYFLYQSEKTNKQTKIQARKVVQVSMCTE